MKINKAEKLADIHIGGKINSIKKRVELKN